MTDLLMDLSQSSLATAVQANINAFFGLLARSPHQDPQTSEGLVRWHTTLPHPWFNGVVCARAPEADERETIAEAVRYFQSRDVPVFTWWLQPGLSFPDWGKHLEAHGFQFDNSTPGMGLDLARVDFAALDAADLRIRVVEDGETLRVWADTFVEGYGLPRGWGADFLDLMGDMGWNLPLRHYLGYQGDEPVAVSTLFLAAGSAGIYNVATRPSARGQGFGSILSLYPLKDAVGMGYRAAVLQSSDMGLNVYRRIGFEKVCDMDHFYWNGTAKR